jgi:hypothetical protein
MEGPMTVNELQAFVRQLRTVPSPDCDCADMLSVFATVAAEEGWSEALEMFDAIAAGELPPSQPEAISP